MTSTSAVSVLISISIILLSFCSRISAGLGAHSFVGEELFDLETGNVNAKQTWNYLFPEDSFDEFLNEYWQKKFFRARKSNDSDRFDALFSLSNLGPLLDSTSNCPKKLMLSENYRDILAEALETPALYPEDFSFVKRVRASDDEWWTGTVPIESLRKNFDSPENPVSNSALFQIVFQRGYSLIVNKMNCRWKTLFKLAKYLFKNCLYFPLNINMYFTPGEAQAFEAHSDWMESIIIQVSGRKRWKIYPLSSESSTFLQFAPMRFKPRAKSLGQPIEDFIAEPGDAFYVPNGQVHEAFTLLEAKNSLHFTIGIEIDPSRTWIGLVLLSLKYIERSYKPVWSYRYEFFNFMVFEAALVPENHFLRRAVPFGDWLHVPHSERNSFLQKFIQICHQLLSQMNCTRAKGRLVNNDFRPLIPSSLEIYFPALISELDDSRSNFECDEELYQFTEYLTDSSLFFEIMSEFVRQGREENSMYYTKVKALMENNYRRLADLSIKSTSAFKQAVSHTENRDEL